ncbi:MAG TPA: homoserine kinase [Acidimicrobiales bacterium]|nr:homoserine kinase [Acidimicrobiales bacterium]
MRARVPASSANLGPGFDALAIALNCYVQVDIEPAGGLSVHSEGEGAGLFDDASHLAVQVAKQVLGHDRIAVTVRSQIPVSRGLGSSAALAAAAAAAAGADDPFTIAAAVDGHPENAAASVFGGLIAAATVDGQPRSVPLPLSDELAYVVMVPDRTLSTADARQVLPDQLSRTDATFNLGRMGLLLAGLADPSLLMAAAAEDRIHQPARTAIFPEAPQLLSALLTSGALASCWSGAGSSLLGITTPAAAEGVQRGAEVALKDASLPGRVFLLQVDRRGLVYGDEAELPN